MTKLKDNYRIFDGTIVRNIRMEPERKDIDANYECFVSKLDVTLTLSTMIRKDERCKILLFDDRQQIVGWSSYLTDEKDEGRVVRRIKMLMASNKVWYAGRYVMLFRYAASMALRINWQLDADHSFIPLSCGVCEYMSDEDEMLEYFFSDVSRHMQIYDYPGMQQVTAMLMRRFHQTTLNGQRDLKGEGNLQLCRHYMIETRNNLRMSDLGEAISWVGRFPGRYKSVDCNILCLEATDLGTSYGTSQIFSKSFDPEEYDSQNSSERIDYCILLQNIGALLRKGGKSVLWMLSKYLRSESYSFILMGIKMELDELLDQNPSLADYFLPENRLVVQPFDDKDLTQLFLLNCRKRNLNLSDLALVKAYRMFRKVCENSKVTQWGDDETGKLVRKIADAYTSRCISGMQDSLEYDITQVQPEDIDDFSNVDCEDEYEKAMTDLQSMIGLNVIKQDITTLTNRMRFFAKRKQLGLPVTGNTVHHAIFTGNPGTGKTTVARMLGRIYHSLGLLSKGDVIVVDRRRIVGQYIGDTENNMDQILQEARGNVLFVDEAYTLYNSDDTRDFGRHAIECLLTVLSQKNLDMLVIFAGYEKEMNELMSMNPGLVGRFPNKFKFVDYTIDELMLIADRQFQQEQYVLTEEARVKLRCGIETVVQQHSKNFSNARWVEQFVNNGIIPAMANRLATMPHAFTRETYQQVVAEDVEAALQKFNPQTVELRPHRAVGF